jgi:hypothetical protein
LFRLDFLHGSPLHGDFAREFGLDDQRFVVGLLDGSGQAVAILFAT